MNPELKKALETVAQGMTVAILGVSQGKISRDEAVTIAALVKCDFYSSDELLKKRVI